MQVNAQHILCANFILSTDTTPWHPGRDLHGSCGKLTLETLSPLLNVGPTTLQQGKNGKQQMWSPRSWENWAKCSQRLCVKRGTEQTPFPKDRRIVLYIMGIHTLHSHTGRFEEGNSNSKTALDESTAKHQRHCCVFSNIWLSPVVDGVCGFPSTNHWLHMKQDLGCAQVCKRLSGTVGFPVFSSKRFSEAFTKTNKPPLF